MNVTFGQVLYDLRKKCNESQENVATAVDISTVAYTRYENDQREPKASIAIRLAQHFGVTVEYLYSVEGNREIKPSLPGEKSLLEMYRSLSAERRNDLLQYADYLLTKQTEEKGRAESAG